MTPPGAGRRVLLVDDAAEVRMLLELVLSADGFEVATADDGPSGVAAAQGDPPDVVLLDVQLPGMDGPDVLRALRGRGETAEVPVVFLTATPASHDAELLSLGALGVLRKPFDADKVSAQLAGFLGG